MATVSYGEYVVGVNFNPSGDPLVDRIKKTAAELIDLIDAIPCVDASERGRLKGLAIDDIESGAMWAVKAATKPPRLVD